MSPTEFAAVAGSIAWPLTVIGLVAAFNRPLRKLFEQLATSLKIKGVKLKIPGGEIELTVEQAERALNELLQEIIDPANELSDQEKSLFKSILSSSGRSRVDELIPNFRRDTSEHGQLRNLRDRKMVRPFEGGKWEPHKHPIATRFGRLVHDLRNAKAAKDAG